MMQDPLERDERTLRFARAELRRVLAMLSLRDLARHAHFALMRPGKRRPMGGLRADGFAVLPEGSEYRIVSGCVRGIVYGVYGLLESLGCRWYFPGPGGVSASAAGTTPGLGDVREPGHAAPIGYRFLGSHGPRENGTHPGEAELRGAVGLIRQAVACSRELEGTVSGRR